MKTKSIKMISALIIAFLAVILLGTTNVKATEREFNVITKNTLVNGLMSKTYIEGDNAEWWIGFNLDTDKLYTVLTQNNISNITEDGYVYDLISLEVPEDINKVKIEENGELSELTIQESNGKKYVDYKLKLFKNDLTVEQKWQEILTAMYDGGNKATLKIYDESDNLSEEKINISVGVLDALPMFAICGENGKVPNGIDPGHGDINGLMYNLDASFDYSKCYFVLAFTHNVGNSVNVEGLGEFSYLRTGTLEYEEDSSWNINNAYIYKYDITDKKILSENGVKEYNYTFTLSNTTLSSTSRFYIHIYGEKPSTGGGSSSTTNTTVNKADTTTGIKLEGTTNVISNNIQLVVKPLESSKVNISNLNIKKFVAHDIKLLLNGTAIQPNGKVKISIPVPKDFDDTKLTVYRIADNGEKTEYKTTVETKDNTKYATFETDHFSTYILAEKETANNNTGNTGTSNKAELDETPKTGDNIYEVCTLLAVIIIANVGLIIYRIKK